jgi:hypothetical protein
MNTPPREEPTCTWLIRHHPLNYTLCATVRSSKPGLALQLEELCCIAHNAAVCAALWTSSNHELEGTEAIL